MSCTISHCFGKSKQSIDVFQLNNKINTIIKKGRKNMLSSKKKQKQKRHSNYRKKNKKNTKKHNRYSKRKFGYKVIRNDQIIELINNNKVYNNKICN